jgi:glutamate dehydrogenase (NADP+)
MTALYRYIGPDVDVPAGDEGVGGREIGYMFGQYRRLKGVWENGVLTGKGMTYGGSRFRPEATGYGAMYYLNNVLAHEGDTIKGKTIAVSGYGNVAWGICKKAKELGAKVVTISGRDGYVYDEEGITSSDEKINFLLEMRASKNGSIKDYADKFGVPFFPGEKPWGRKVDIAMPAATQNEVVMADAEKIAANGVKYYMEVSNMSTTNDALNFLRTKDMIVGPAKAVNAGGVGVSALEMSQNSERLVWTAEEVDAKLEAMMKDIHDASAKAAETYGLGYDLVSGANIAGFTKVAEAMMAQGIF